MNQDSTHHTLLDLSFDLKKYTFNFELSWVVVATLIVLAAIALFIRARIFRKSAYFPVEMVVQAGTSSFASVKVKRDSTNLYIANRIYLELVTRKAAIKFDADKDVIAEVYDSWKELFKIIREEIKSVPGDFLISHDPTVALIGLTTKILNEGLRPHLTSYQADFRRWFNEEIKQESNKSKSPQQIQKAYPGYQELVADMASVNGLLEAYAEQLKKLIKG